MIQTLEPNTLSDAAQEAIAAADGVTVEAALESAKQMHTKAVMQLGSEAAYVEAHGAMGTTVSEVTGVPKTMISWTKDLATARYFANGGPVFQTTVPVAQVIKQTLPTSTEAEYLIRYGVKAVLLEP